MLGEFKEFISRGSVIDLAVGIVVGAAFTAIVNSFVADILMPPVGWLTGGIDFSNLFINLSGGDYRSLAEAEVAGAATINYGRFINAVTNFLIVAAALFIVIRQVNRFRRKPEPTAPPPPPRQEVLLEEIRDLLRGRPVSAGSSPAE